MLKQLTYTAIFAVIVVAALRLGAFPDKAQFSQASQTLKAFLLPAIFVVAMIGLALVVIATKVPHLATAQRLNQFAWFSGAGLAAVFLAAFAYIKLAP
jgi:hypothetical protein